MRNFAPNTQQFNQRKVLRQMDGFGKGAFDDLLGSKIPKDGVKYSENYVLYKDRAIPRGGSKRWTDTTLPPLSGRTGYSLTKTGTTVTKTAGTDFSENDVGNYVVYDDGKHELIIAYIGPTQVTVNGSTAHAASVAAWIRGPATLYRHLGFGKIFLHIDTRLFVAADITITSWTECLRIGPLALSKEKMIVKEQGDYLFLFNSNRIFKVEVQAGEDTPIYYPLNTAVPGMKPNGQYLRITEIAETETLVYGYKYVYTLSRISGAGMTGDRTSNGAVVEQESGPSIFDPGAGKDYGLIFAARPVGEGDTYYAKLVGAALGAGYDTAVEWAALGSNPQFKASINGTTYNVPVDATGVESLKEMADRIQTALRDFNNKITFQYVTDHYVMTNPAEGGTLGYVTAGAGGTDIGTSILGMQAGTGTLYSSDTTPASGLSYTSPITVGTLTMPTTTDDPNVQQHWTHYSIYRTLDVGANGEDPQKGTANNTEQFIWVADIKIVKPFSAYVSGNKIFLNPSGPNLQKEDVGSCVYFPTTLDEVTIAGYTSATQATCSHADVSAGVYLPAIIKESQAGAGLGMKVATASQAATTVTSTAGDAFIPADVGKVLHWADGAISIITGYTDAANVTAYPSQTRPSQAVGFMRGDASASCTRMFYDIIRDDYNGTSLSIKKLRDRAAGFCLPNRFWEPLPIECDCGTIQNGWLLAAERGTKTVNYSDIIEGMEYLCGYHNPNEQIITVLDAIEHIQEFEGAVAVIQYNRMDGVPLLTYSTKTIPQAGEVVDILTEQYIISKEIGSRDWGSVEECGRNQVMIHTSEPGFRILRYTGGGFELSDELTQDRIKTRVQKCIDESASTYDTINGYIWWSINTQSVVAAVDHVLNEEHDADAHILDEEHDAAVIYDEVHEA